MKRLLPRLAGHLGLIVVLAAGAAIRFWNIGWGLPQLYEEAIPLRFAMKLWPSLPPAADTHFFVYPAFGYYVHLFAQFLHYCAGFAAGSYTGLTEFIAGFAADPTAYTVVSRATTILFDLGVAAATYGILDRRHGRTPALLSAAFIAFNVLHVRQSHLINVDTLLVFASVMALSAFLRVADRPDRLSYILAGAAVGVAAASKYNGAVLTIPFLIAHCVGAGGIREGLRPHRLPQVLLAGAVSIGVFLLFNPLIIPHFGRFLEKFRSTETHMEAGHLGLDPNQSTAAYYLFESLPDNLGIPILVVAVLSIVYVARSSGPRKYILLSIPAVYGLMLFSWEMRADRYIFPVVPFLLLIAGIGTAAGVKWADRRLRGGTPAGTPGSSVAGRLAPVAAGALLLIPQWIGIVQSQRSISLPDTRTAAMAWIENNLRPGSTVATGPMGIELSVKRYVTLPIQFSAVNSERMTPFYNPGWYRDIDLLVVSDFDYARYAAEPVRFREILNYLDTLRTSWTLVRAFEQGDSMSGPGIRLYRYPGDPGESPYPEELVAQLLSSDLETERKVAFLGKLGLIQSLQGKLVRSEQLFRMVLDLEPGNETALRAMREIAAFEAGRDTGRGLSPGAAGPGDIPGAARQKASDLTALGDSLLSEGRLDEAAAAFRAALGLDRYQASAYMGLTLVFAARDDRAGVVQTLRELLKVLPPGSADYARVQWQLRSIEEGKE